MTLAGAILMHVYTYIAIYMHFHAFGVIIHCYGKTFISVDNACMHERVHCLIYL